MYIVCETLEREISEPVFFRDLASAQQYMNSRFDALCNGGDNAECGDMEAYCESANHDNCDWKIFNIVDLVPEFEKYIEDLTIRGKI